MLRIYACGGSGGNISKQLSDLDIEVCYIDTSKSNLKGIDDSKIFLTSSTDGSGKDRSVSYEAFKPHIEDILIRFKPSQQLNVVISSLSGGSGSVISPLITKELISNGYNTIVIAVDSKHSLKEIDNTVKTLKSYQAISSSTKKTVAMYYIENNSRKDADQQAIYFINLLSLLVNKEHTSEFDTKDLHNFIEVSNVTDNKPTVTIIDVSANENIVPEKNTAIVSTILVTSDPHSTISPATPEYLATCIVTDKNYKNEDIRVDALLGKLSVIIGGLEEDIKTHREAKKISKHTEVVVDGANEDDLVI